MNWIRWVINKNSGSGRVSGIRWALHVVQKTKEANLAIEMIRRWYSMWRRTFSPPRLIWNAQSRSRAERLSLQPNGFWCYNLVEHHIKAQALEKHNLVWKIKIRFSVWVSWGMAARNANPNLAHKYISSEQTNASFRRKCISPARAFHAAVMRNRLFSWKNRSLSLARKFLSTPNQIKSNLMSHSLIPN